MLDRDMSLSQLTFKRYKAFARREVLDIRPLTILIGRNNSGKSTIARLPVLLGQAFSRDATGPLELSAGGLDFGGSLLDLIHGRSVHGSINLGFRVDDGTRWFDWKFKLQHFDEYKLQSIDIAQVQSSAGERVRLVRESTDPRPPRQRYTDEHGRQRTLQFNGLQPDGDDVPTLFMDALPCTLNSLRSIRYLGPFRERPARFYVYSTRPPSDVGPLGNAAPSILGDDDLRGDGQLIQRVSRLFEVALGTGAVEVARHGDNFAVTIRDRFTNTPINLVDTGVGLGQVLPLVVQRMLDIDTESSGVEIVEQPELHLHPQAHGALADLYINALASGTRTRFLIETHAENILLRIRRRVAERVIAPEQVSIYWIRTSSGEQSRILPIQVDGAGELDVWPRGVFAEDFEEARAIARARMAREQPE